jgi:hypothetical protein
MAINRPVTKTIISTTAWGIPITDQVNANTTDIAALKAVPAWTGVTFSNGWSNFGTGYQLAQYRKVGDMVYVRGTITGGAAGTIAFTLPTGFRPPASMGFPGVVFTSTRQILLILVNNSGQVIIYDYTGNVDLNTVAFSITT